MTKPTQEQRDTLPHIIMTGDMDWDPRCMDYSYTNTDGEANNPYSALIDEEDLYTHFNQRNSLTREIIHPADAFDLNYQDPRDPACSNLANNHKYRPTEFDSGPLSPHFG